MFSIRFVKEDIQKCRIAILNIPASIITDSVYYISNEETVLWYNANNKREILEIKPIYVYVCFSPEKYLKIGGILKIK